MTAEPTFKLRFPISEVGRWADRYAYADDAEVEAIGKAAGQRGWYTKAELVTVARWKTRGRSGPRIELNTPAAVRKATTTALATNDERERVGALVGLHGVQLPTASVLLHLAQPKLFPIIDFRALWSLGIDEAPVYYGFNFWWKYTLACRALAAYAKVSMRRLDRALWQYSKQNQRPAAPVAAADPGVKRTTVARPARRPERETIMAEAPMIDRPQQANDAPRDEFGRWAVNGSQMLAVERGSEILLSASAATLDVDDPDGKALGHIDLGVLVGEFFDDGSVELSIHDTVVLELRPVSGPTEELGLFFSEDPDSVSSWTAERPRPPAKRTVDDRFYDPIVVISYPGRTQADAAALFAKHANKLVGWGYRPISQSWGEGRPGVGRVVTLGLFASSIRPNGFLTVTYERVATQPAPMPTLPDDPGGLAGRLSQLQEAHRGGLITDEEYAAKRAEILASL
jgi:hypothetical protein